MKSNLIQPTHPTPLPPPARLLFSPDMETVTDACWALSYLSDGPNERIQAVLNAGVAPRLVELLGSETSTVQTPGTIRSIFIDSSFFLSIVTFSFMIGCLRTPTLQTLTNLPLPSHSLSHTHTQPSAQWATL